ncbi:hypothetical protein [Chitiniphilus eburneus]|uniref:Transferrin-binding protein-like solute binding protein n=1 Tax=Chitiniphilus eburneus TaxID=2571148 RepID=A0A4U0PFX0_9NEIS|nr:hypothetical protein [Chitiniphilus eburneus]TJZ66841.1 hypothetical protein FAZ21_16795 [Chitiniphilus eburneus]
MNYKAASVTLALTSVFSLGLISCNGPADGTGGGDPSPTPTTAPTPTPVPAQGIYRGSTSDSRQTTTLIVPSGQFYTWYTTKLSSSIIGGGVEGVLSASDGTLASNNAVDYNIELGTISPASITGSYTEQSTISGSLTYGQNADTVTFSANYDSAYENTPSLAAVAGSYDGLASSPGGTEVVVLTVDSDGKVTGVDTAGCAFSGTVTPDATHNYYAISTTFGVAPCVSAGLTFTGVALYETSGGRLLGMAPNSSRTGGVIFNVVKRP